MADARRRLLLVALVGVLPWTAIGVDGFWAVFSPVGYLTVTPMVHFVSIYDYLFVYTQGLPQFVLSWPIGIVIYLTALASAALGLVGREDRRVTAGLLVLVGLTQASFAFGFGRRRSYVAIPLATVTTLALAWWVYWPDLYNAMFARE